MQLLIQLLMQFRLWFGRREVTQELAQKVAPLDVAYRILCSLCTGVLLLSVACKSDTTGPAPVDPTQLFYQVTLKDNAITMALTPPYDTLQLVATLRSASGTPLTDTGVTTWTSSDSTSVQISPTGLLTALAPASNVQVTARHTIGGVTLTAVAYVDVNTPTTVPRLARLVLQPSPTYIGIPFYDVRGNIDFVPSALDTHGDTIANVAFVVNTVTPTLIVGIGFGDALGNGGFWLNPGGAPKWGRVAVGHAIMTVEATVYGVHRVDSLPYTIGWWHQALVVVQSRVPSGSHTPISMFLPNEDTIAAGGTVIWQNQTGAPIDVVFDNPSAAYPADSATLLGGLASVLQTVIPNQGGGNIPAFAPLDTGALLGEDTLGTRARRFPVTGTYHYHSTRYGTSGTIHVLPEFQVP